MLFLQGADDVFTVSSEVERYAGEIVAPSVEYVPIEGAGHAALLLADDLHTALSRHVLPKLLRSEPGVELRQVAASRPPD
jgi:pimeloyl-ACP methyl ester carboxylesterase